MFEQCEFNSDLSGRFFSCFLAVFWQFSSSISALKKIFKKNSQHTMLLKIGRLLAMIVHCMVQFIVDCCKSCEPDILKIILYIKRRPKSEIKTNSQHTILMKFGEPLAIIVHYMV